jgi:hypothetical protein
MNSFNKIFNKIAYPILTMEKRKYPRLRVDLPAEYLIQLPDSGESFAGRGVLENISQGGMLFKCPPPLPLDNGDIGKFTINTAPVMRYTRYTSRLEASGRVVRIETPKENTRDFFGIAVQFLSNLNVEIIS